MSPLLSAMTRDRYVAPPPDMTDEEAGDNILQRLRDYCILHPQQPFSVRALLPEYPEEVRRDLEYRHSWSKRHRVREWPVRAWVEGGSLRMEQLVGLVEDPKLVKKAWEMGGEDGEGSGSSAGHTYAFMTFESRQKATRFWRTWHLRPLPPDVGTSLSDQGEAPILHVEMLR